jgi:hypothetical protein
LEKQGNETLRALEYFWKTLAKERCHDYPAERERIAKSWNDEFTADVPDAYFRIKFPDIRKLMMCSNALHNGRLFVDHNDTIPVCDTKECIKTSALISEISNTNIPPCENFILHACSGLHIHAISERFKEVSIRNQFSEKWNGKMRRALLTKIKETDIEPIKMAKRLYRECSGNDCKLFRYFWKNQRNLPIVIF